MAGFGARIRARFQHGIRSRLLAATATLLAGTGPAMAAPPAPSSPALPGKPNFLVIVADDLGFSDLGAFGGEIATPNLDRLAMSGVRLAAFHTAPACAPTRAMLLTGSDSHRVGLGNMPESMAPNQVGQPGYEGFLRADTATIAERLAAGGYRTMFSGKWHLGVEPAQDPHARGFAQSFAMLHCCHNHFGLGATDDPRKMPGYRRNGITVSTLPADFYSSDFFADRLIDQLRAGRAGPDEGKPFFAYLAFTAPHAPLQAPPETVAKYRGHYDAGYDALRERRLKRQVELGLLDPKVAAHRMVDAPAWASLSPAEQRAAARRMEIYVAMVDRMDAAVGRVIAALRETGELDNTVIFFLSDNGAEGRQVAYANTPTAADIDAMGTARSYVNYGRGWAQAASAPYWRMKSYTGEGGIRSVAFVSGPGVRRPGSIATAFTHVADIAPTMLDLARLPAATTTFAGRTVQPVDGLSWTPLLRSGARVYPESRAVGTELFGSRAIQQGRWKLTDIGDGRWRLFDTRRDPGETRDLSSENPRRRAAMLRAWDRYAASVNVVIPSPPLHPNPPRDTE